MTNIIRRLIREAAEWKERFRELERDVEDLLLTVDRQDREIEQDCYRFVEQTGARIRRLELENRILKSRLLAATCAFNKRPGYHPY